MGSICVEIDGILLATVDLSTVHMLDARVQGALYDALPGNVHVIGGMFEGDSKLLTWIEDRPIRAGELLTIKMLDSCTDPQPGLTYEEMYPDGEPIGELDLTITDDMDQKLRARPLLRNSFALRAQTSPGAKCDIRNEHGHDSFSFSIAWNHYQPDQARVYVSTTSRDGIIRRRPGFYHLETSIGFGDSATFFMRV